MSNDLLTAKQTAFATEYLLDHNATQAAIRAGYSAKTAEVQGPRLLGNVRVALAIQAGQAVRSERTRISADAVLNELSKIGYANMLDYICVNSEGTAGIDLSNLTREQAAAITELTSEDTYDAKGNLTRRNKIKLADKRAALVDIGRHLGLFKDRVEITGKDGGAVQVEAVRQRITDRLNRIVGLLPAPDVPA